MSHSRSLQKNSADKSIRALLFEPTYSVQTMPNVQMIHWCQLFNAAFALKVMGIKETAERTTDFSEMAWWGEVVSSDCLYLTGFTRQRKHDMIIIFLSYFSKLQQLCVALQQVGKELSGSQRCCDRLYTRWTLCSNEQIVIISKWSTYTGYYYYYLI